MRLRFSIRDLIWLAVVAALALAWLVDHRRVVTQLEYCYEQLLTTEQELSDAKRTAEDEILAVRSNADQAIRAANRRAAMVEERPLPIPNITPAN